MSSQAWSSGREARRVRIYVGEEDSILKVPAHHAIVAFLLRHDAAGVTVMRGTEGFGASGRTHSARLADVPWDLPVVVEWVDTPERVDLLLPELKTMVPAGMITVDPTEVVLFARRPVRPVSGTVAVESVMTSDVVSVHKDTPVRVVVERMREHSVRAIPVTDAGIVVGIITSSDLVGRADLGVRLTLLPGLAPSEQNRRMAEMPQRRAEQVMSAPAVVIRSDAPLNQAAEVMVRKRLKRLPVVDDHGQLVGIVSRLDLLRTVADFGRRQPEVSSARELEGDSPVSAIMRADVPTVYPDSPLDEVVHAVVSTRLNRALVVDAERRVLGIVTARAVLERVTPALHPPLLRSLMHRLPFLRPDQEQREIERHAAARNARDLMNANVLKARPDDRLADVVASMVEGRRKLVAVVDDAGRLLGVVDRADVLRGALDMLAA